MLPAGSPPRRDIRSARGRRSRNADRAQCKARDRTCPSIALPPRTGGRLRCSWQPFRSKVAAMLSQQNERNDQCENQKREHAELVEETLQRLRRELRHVS